MFISNYRKNLGRTLLVLGRVSNLPTVWANGLTGWLLAGGVTGIGAGAGSGAPVGSVWPLGMLLAGGSLLYVAGMYLNDAVDVEWDREHAPERPIPAGRIARRTVFGLALVLLCAGVFLLVEGASVDWGWLGALVVSLAAYDMLHKKWAGSILLMGGCRFFLVMMAGSAGWASPGSGMGTAGGIDWRVWVAAGALFFYVVGVTIAARGERKGGREVNRFAWICFAAPVGAWVVLAENEWGVVMLVLYVVWVLRSAGHLRVKADPCRGEGFVGRMLAGMVLVDAMFVAGPSPATAGVCVGFLLVCLGLQRWVPAT